MSTPFIVFSCCWVRITPAHINKPLHIYNKLLASNVDWNAIHAQVWMKYANSQRERKFNLKIETWTKKEIIGNLVRTRVDDVGTISSTPHLSFYLLTTFDVPLVALYTLCVSSPFAQDNEVDGRMKSRMMICRTHLLTVKIYLAWATE